LSQVTSDRNSANIRVNELEIRVAELEKAVTAAVKRAEDAEQKEQALAKQEEDLIPRLEAIVNSLSGKNFFLCYSSNFLIIRLANVLFNFNYMQRLWAAHPNLPIVFE